MRVEFAATSRLFRPGSLGPTRCPSSPPKAIHDAGADAAGWLTRNHFQPHHFHAYTARCVRHELGLETGGVIWTAGEGYLISVQMVWVRGRPGLFSYRRH